MSENENIFSGSTNTMVALGMVASLLALALSVWSITRVGELEAFVALQAIQAQAQAQAQAEGS